MPTNTEPNYAGVSTRFDGTSGDDVARANPPAGVTGFTVPGSPGLTAAELLALLQDLNGDEIYGFGGNDTIVAGVAADTIYGGDGNDSILGGGGNDSIFGDDGDDFINGFEGADTVDGGAGSDVLRLTLQGDVNSLNSASNEQLTNVEAIFAQFANASINLSSQTEGFQIGAVGNSTVVGSQGIDTFELSAISSVYTPNSDSALVGVEIVSAENVTFFNPNPLAGGNLNLSTQTESFTIKGGVNNDTLVGGAGNDTLTGGAGNDSLGGGAGDDLIYGRSGDLDTLNGGAGSDIYEVYAGTVIVEAAETGTDWVYAYANYTLSANVENLVLAGSSTLSGTGNSGNNALYGNGAANTLDGGDGNDTLIGGNGNDSLVGGIGDDLLRGANLDVDTLVGGSGNDTYEAYTSTVIVEATGGGNDWVSAFTSYTLSANLETLFLEGTGNFNGTGNSGNNTLYGNSGNNFLAGAAGNDTLTGGSGSDIFSYATGTTFAIADTGLDYITDFATTVDQILLNKTTFAELTSVAGTGFSVANEFAVVTSRTQAEASNALIVYNSVTGGLLYNQNRSDAGLGTGDRFAILGGGTLAASDFILIDESAS
jgi:Ca2+-binding RTX toxin-like protein